MIPRTLIGIFFVLMLAIVVNPCFALAADIYKTNTTVVSIPDDGYLGNSKITISDASIPANAVVTGVDVGFTSDHQRSQDLEVYLQYGSSIVHTNYKLWNHEGGTSPNPTKTATGVSLFNGLGVKKDWYLYVKDTSPGATGNLTSWWIRVYYTSASGSGGAIYSVNASFLNNLTFGNDSNNDGYNEEYEFLSAIDVVAPTGVKVYPKIICNTTGQAWRSQTGNYNNDHLVQYWDQGNFLSYITQNATLNFTVELWSDSNFSQTKLASTAISGAPINVGVGYFPSGWLNAWTPGTDSDTDGYYDTYQFQLGVEGVTYMGPATDVITKIICTTTSQSWWASEPWTISSVAVDNYFDFTEADFAGYISDNAILDFLVELWNPSKTTKLGSTTYHGNYIPRSLKVDSSPCSVAVNSVVASNTSFDPYTGGSTNFTGDITATPSATWRLTIDGGDVASGETSTVSQLWYGKNSLGHIFEPGTYIATLSASDPSGQCTDTKSILVTIDKKAPPVSNSCEANPEIPIGSTANVTTGGVSHSQSVLSLKGAALSASIELFYNSLNPYNGPLGPGWSHTYDISVTEKADGSILLREGVGGKSLYTKSGSSYIPPAGDFSTLVKNADGTYIISYRDGQKYNFRTDGKIGSIVDRFNNAIAFTYTNGDLTGITDSAQRLTAIGYDTMVTPHRIMSITDPNQKTYDFAYQGSLLWKVIDPAADPAVDPTRGYWEYLYDTQGFLKSKRDPQNNLTQYNYYADHRLENAIDPEGVTDPNNHTRSIVYPATTGNLKTTTVTEKDGGQWLYTYDAQAGVLKQKSDPNGKVTNYTFYSSGYLKSKTEPFDGDVRLTTFYTYDSYGNLLTQTDPVNLGTYDPPIDPENVTDPATLITRTPSIKPVIRYVYDYANYDRITSISDERGTIPLVTSLAYTIESNGDVVTATAPGNIVTIIKYNPNGTVREIVDANQKTTVFTYYPDTADNRTAGVAGLLQAVTGPDSITITITSYDKNGNPLEMTVKDTAGTVRLTSSQQHDALNRLRQLTKTTASLPDIVTRYGYDNTGNLNSLIDAETRETKYEYRYDGQVKKITDAKQNETVFSYGSNACPSCGGGMDKLSAITDAKQHATSFIYDKLGRLEYETDPLGRKLYYTYYDNGLLKQKYDATAATPGTLLATYVYNNRGQITDKTFADGTYEHYTYYPDGKLWTAANQNIGYTYVYYPDGRLQMVTDTTNNRVISYDQYDGLGQRKQVTVLNGAGADQRVVSYDYDSANRPWHITSAAGTFTYSYDNLGRRDTVTYPNNTLTDWDFDDLNRLTAVTHKVAGGAAFAAFTYQEYDKVGNRKNVSGNKNETYGYDELYRLLSVTSTNPESFNFDAVGNRQNGPSPADSAYVHNNANQMTVGRKLGYGYDNLGNQTSKTLAGVTDKSWVQTWDSQNRLVKVEKTKGAEKRTVTFQYDPLGRRITKQLTTVIDGVTKTQTWSYLYDGDSIAVEFYTDENNTTTKTFYTQGPGVDEHLALERGGQFYYYHADGLGSVATITDGAHAVVESYEYDSYGMVTPSTGFRNSYAYTGREWDKEEGLYYYRARYYDPMEGRFVSKDPIGFDGGDVDLYGYVQGNPVSFIDPWGLIEEEYDSYIKSGGSVSWRNNNPGNMVYGPRAVSYGAIGKSKHNKFAKFSSEEDGMKALNLLLKERYSDYLVKDMIEKYAPRFENDTDAYLNFLTKRKIDINKKVNCQIDELAKAIKIHEGWIKGKIIQK